MNMLEIELADGSILVINQKEARTSDGQEWIQKKRDAALEKLINMLIYGKETDQDAGK